MAWVAPSKRAIVSSVPGDAGPGGGGALDRGQIRAQLPSHFDVVAVSGANQYSVKPWGVGQHSGAADRRDFQRAAGHGTARLTEICLSAYGALAAAQF